MIHRRLLVFALVAVLAGIVPGPGRAAPPTVLPETTPHGVLLDRSLPLAHATDLDGSPAAPAADLARWRQAVHEIRRAAERPLPWPASRDLAAAARDRHPRATVPLGLVSAVVDRLADTGEVVPARIFALAPLRPETHHGAAVRFVLDPAALLVHGTARPTHFLFDADDGRGWRPLVPGRPLAVAYDKPGRRTLRLRAGQPDGTVLEAAARLDVARLVTPPPTATWSVTGAPWDGVAGTGQAYLYLAAGRTLPENPVIVVEGFDLDDSMDWPALYDLLSQENLIEDLRADGYDAVVLDFTEATAPLQRNGLVVGELVTRVRDAAGPGATSVLIGASMGGLVSRYALAHLEAQGIPHGVRTFISFDSPQEGANIPLGLQHWLGFFRSESESADFLLSRLDSPAARQMLLYHHAATSGTAAGPDPLRPAFLADLAALGDWPGAPRLVAVANGSGAGAGQGFGAGAQIIRYEYRSLLVDIDGNVWAVGDGPPGVVFDGMMNLLWPLPDDYETVTVGGTLPWDNAPGGWRPSMAQMDTTAVPYGDIEALHDAHCFIPTVSALALDTADPFLVPAALGDAAALSPFDALYWPDLNEEHVAITPGNKAWLVGEITAGASGVPSGLPVVAAVRLLPPVPNPFNPRTRLRFVLERDAAVDLAVFDVAGRRVRTLAAGAAWSAGRHDLAWDGRTDTGRPAAAGRYVVRLVAGGEVATTGLVLVK